MNGFWTNLLAGALITVSVGAFVAGASDHASAAEALRTECVGVLLPVERLDADPDATAAMLGSSSRSIPSGWKVVAGGGLGGSQNLVVSAIICRER